MFRGITDKEYRKYSGEIIYESDRTMHLNWRLSSVYYGWWIIGALFLILLFVGGFVVLGFTAFFEPIASEFGWSYAQVSLAGSFRGVEVGLLAPLIGLVVDRWGPRRLAFAGIFITACGLVFLSRINSLGMFYFGYILIAIGMSGISATVIMTIAANWFRKKVGIATGIMGTGFAIGGLLVPLVVKLIEIFDWRTAFLILGLIVFVVCLPLSLLLRHRPEQYGYMLDGDKSINAIPDQVRTPAQTHEVNIETKKALRSFTFWHLGLAIMFQYTVVCAVTVHVMPFLSSIGISRSTASFVATAVPLASIAGRLGSGWLADRFNKKRVATVFFAVMILGLLCLSYASSEAMWIVVSFVILFGIGWGGNNTMRVSLVREYFGRNKFGSIFGFMMGLTVVGGIAGPFFAGWVYDNWTSYHVAWLAFSVLVFVGMIILATTPPVTSGVQLADTR